jgi:hypothetical protein
MSNRPSAEAIAVCRDLVFETLTETLELAGSYAISAREAAWRGSEHTVGIHLRQLRDSTVNAIQIFKQLDELSL